MHILKIKAPLKIIALVGWEDKGINKYLWVARFPIEKTENLQSFCQCLAFIKLETLRSESRTTLGHKVKIFQVMEACRQLANMTQRS